MTEERSPPIDRYTKGVGTGCDLEGALPLRHRPEAMERGWAGRHVAEPLHRAGGRAGLNPRRSLDLRTAYPQSEKLEYRAARKPRISSSPKAL